MNTASAVLLSGLLASLGGAPRLGSHVDADRRSPMRISTNDNRRAAGTLRDGKLELKLEIVNGNWFPESDSGPSAVMQVFAEAGRAPEIPGPMIRVPEGTVIHVTLRNLLPDAEVVVHGLHSRPATADEGISIPAGATRDVTFESGPAGTYFYWATTTKHTLLYRNDLDSQLSGAIVVDPRDAPLAKDRTFVIGVFHEDKDSVAGRVPHPREIVVVNGKSWPYTERFTFTEGDTVSWRVINASSAPHPMHLHGFYYNVLRSGGEGADSALAPSAVSQVNTKLLSSGVTMAMRFIPDRAGNWLFHCHLAVHVDGTSKLANMINFRPMDALLHEHAHAAHGINEMAGLIIGIHVLPRGTERRAVSAQQPQQLRLLIQSSPRGYNHKAAIGFVLQNGAEPAKDSVTLPGPTLFLEKGRPTRITVVNRLTVPTSVHWHGMEIESYPDGVAGWSGIAGRIAPAIQPADSFTAEFTPPRAGTFIYHSHINELMQTNSGMYGALVVTDSAHPFDPRIDKIVLVGGGGPGNIEARSPGMVNGTVSPQFDLQVGTTYRLHIIQIHTQAIVIFRLGTDSTTARWTPVAKDGADLPPEQATARAASVVMGAGETEEFLYTPERPGLQKLNVQVRLAGWQVPVLLYVRPAAKLATN
ncbi:MAG: multicopper oxidase domain-containing protein [Gemmatimonadaceae bacterium]